MKVEVPEFLLEMSKNINTQNNHSTDQPMFEVRYDAYLVTESAYNEHHYEVRLHNNKTIYSSCDDVDGTYVPLIAYLLEHDKEWCEQFIEDRTWLHEDEDVNIDELFKETFCECFCVDMFDYKEMPDSLTLLHLQEIEVTVNAHFTEHDAQVFIDRVQHYYPQLYIYPISIYSCEGMAKLRGWIKDLEYA